MGKKGSWFSAIKKVFTHNSKEKLADGGEKKSAKEKKKKKGIGKLKYGDGNKFIPLFREPSSIEKILGDAEREHQVVTNRPLTPPEQPKPPPTPPLLRRTVSPPKVTAVPSTSTPPRAAPRAASPPRNAAQSTPPRPISPPLQSVASAPHVVTQVDDATPVRAPSPRHFQRHTAKPTLEEQYVSAIKIQAAHRGYVARRSYRALRGLVRLQAVVKGQSVKRQTTSALKCMQLLVRVQTQIQSRRIQMENQALQRQAMCKNDKDLESLFSKWNLSENSDEWDDSTLTKEEIEARMQRKVDAVVKRERAMAYAYSHQLWKSTPRTPQSALMDVRSGGFPYWWNWLDQRHHVPPKTPPNPSQSPSIKNFLLTPSRQTPDYKGNTTPLNLRYGTLDTSTPRSTRSAIPTRTKLAQTPPGRLQQKLHRGSVANSPFRDDDSLTSCPSFSVPHYMSPTVSANAKLRGGKEPIPDSPGSVNTTDDSKRRTSFPLGQEFKRNKGPFFSNKETSSSKGLVKNHSFQSIGNLSVDSTVSMPATVGRRAFNRFA